MSWIQENKFVAGLAGVTAVIGGAILYFGSSQGSQYDEKVSEYQALKDEFSKLQKAKPFPSSGNLQAKKDNIAQYEEVIKDVRNTFAGFQPGKMENVSPQQFGNLRVTMDKELREAFGKSEITLPDDTAFGFERYKSSLPKPQATKMLKYELDAVQWLLSQLAAAKPAELNNVLRTQLQVETGRAAAPPKPTRGRPKKGVRRGAPAPAAKAYTLMPMELAFTGSESSVREFLQSMVNSKEYFFSIRALRIRNEKQTPPSVKDANFPAARRGAAGPPAGDEDDPFAGIALPDAGEEGGTDDPDAGPIPIPAPAPAPVAGNGNRILMQILGDEKLHVFIRFDIVFIQGKPAPAKPAKP